MLENQVVRIGNWLTLRRGTRVRPENLLLLFPHCMQWSKCPHNIIYDLSHCRKCGRCKIGTLIDVAERLGLQVFCASGGRQAAKKVMDKSVHAVLAVACEKELSEGMRAVFPKPVLGVINLRPHGPCMDTDVSVEEVESALQQVLLSKSTLTEN